MPDVGYCELIPELFYGDWKLQMLTKRPGRTTGSRTIKNLLLSLSCFVQSIAKTSLQRQ